MSSPDNSTIFYSIYMCNMAPDDMLHVQVFKNRTKELY